jgi:RNA polymerase sigma factor (sigma-70 family)
VTSKASDISAVFMRFVFLSVRLSHRKAAILSYNFFRHSVCDLKAWRAACSWCIFFPTMNLPDLCALKTGDASAWDEAFNWLWPAVFAVAKLKLQPYFPNEVEDVAIESIEQLVKKVPEVKSVEELKPLAASIAHNRAVSLLRERFAKKRGEGKTASLDAQLDEGISQNELTSSDSPLANLEQKELAQLLRKTLAELKPPMGDILSDFFLHGLGYEEIARRRGVPVGSVGVYLKRGLEAMGRIWEREEK